MSRWDYDTVFYRVFCISLLAVAFTFTLILTNVFVDINGLLSKKDKVKPPKPAPEPINHDLTELSRVINVNMVPEDKSEDIYDDKDYQDSNDLYRSKRSLDTPDRVFHIKDPKVKKLLTSHLANLLDELDQEKLKTSKNNDKGTSIIEIKEINDKDKHQNVKKDVTVEKHDESVQEDKDKKIAKENVVEIKKYLKENKRISNSSHEKVNIPKSHSIKKDYKAELLHLAMHNVILQGIIENTDLDMIYNKVVELVKDFENDQPQEVKKLNGWNERSKNSKDDLKHLFKTLEKHIQHERSSGALTGEDSDKQTETETKRSMRTKTEGTSEANAVQTNNGKTKDHKVIIQTTIDITALSNDKGIKENDWNPKDKLNGIVKVIYNGNTIKFKRIDDDNSNNSKIISNNVSKAGNTDHKNDDHISHQYVSKKSNQTFYQKVLYDYFKKYKSESDSIEHKKTFSRKRLKRHIKIRYDTNKTTTKPKTKKDDDELFVEIETHFDSKGAKGEKKKKLIRDLIEKIQSAIHSDNNGHKKKQKHWHVKKRMQNPLSSKSAAVLINKLMLPFETLAHRHLDPISKIVPSHEEMPLVSTVFDHSQGQEPKFFGKSINSAEMNIVDTDYNKVMKHNGIPQRLQKPLNTDMSDEVFQNSKVVDLGNIKFLMKDIDGSGFSIGFNQYTDEAPDTETMKLFSGLENIIQTYHQQYDQETATNSQQQPNANNLYESDKNEAPDEVIENDEQIENSDQHVIQRRSIQGSEEHVSSNNYRIVYGQNSLLPYKSYDEIFNSDKGHVSRVKNTKISKTKNIKKSDFIFDENIFEKDLKPAEILSIADLFERRKRSLKVKKITNLKIKTKMNRYLNTKKMASKSIFINNKKRNKRQIDKIRIIARDLPQHRNSEEEVFVESDEKVFADRALVRDIDIPEIEPNDKQHSVEHYDTMSPPKEEEPFEPFVNQPQKTNEDNFDVFNPYVYDANLFDTPNEFSRRARHNSLMSKYPHIIMEEAPSYAVHGEEFLADIAQPQQYEIESTTIHSNPTLDIPSPNDQDIKDLISPPRDLSNYRVSVKIRPKNATGLSGFKEVHTSINKSYKKNGLMYTSLVNVSQLSKVEKVNKTFSRRDNDQPDTDDTLKQQQDIIKTMIQQHKHRLDMQLKHLQLERLKLETMNLENVENVTDILLNKDPLPSPKKERKSSHRKKSKPETTTVTETTVVATTEPTTTTTEYEPLRTDDHEIKTKMIESIERNENITNELLKKIDLNTGVLKVFLGKLIATIDAPGRKHLEETTTIISDTKSNETMNNDTAMIDHKEQNIDINIPVDNSNHVPFNFDDYRYMPNMIFRNFPRTGNNSYGIPFVYAVQHPYGVVPNKENMASVVYHGHIHTNNVNENNISKRDYINENVIDKRDYLNTNIDNNISKRDYIQTNTVIENHTNNVKPAPKPVVLKESVKVEKKTADTNEFWKPKPGEKVIHDFVINKNNSRFFLDEATNDFKMPMLTLGNRTIGAL